MKILLIEDDLDDIELLQHALSSRNVPFTMKTINDGSAAVAYIQHCDDFPDITILDFNLPKIHGKEIIREIKSETSFKKVPLMILTTSSLKEDREYAYAHGADQYFIKPIDQGEFDRLVEAIVSLAGNRES